MRVGDRVEVAVEAVAIHAATCEHADPVLGDERGCDIVLGGQQIGRAQSDLGAAGLERPHQVGGFGRDMEARADPQSSKGLLLLEALADEPQNRHLPLRPFDARDAISGQGEIGYVVRRQVADGVGRGELGGRHWGSLVRIRARVMWATMLSQGPPRRCARRSSKRQ